jgi:hypothetical protein
MTKRRTRKLKPAVKAAPPRKVAPPLDAATLIPLSFATVCDMEEDVTAASNFADAIAMLAETIDDADGCVFQRMAWTLKKHCDAIEERRGNLFRFLHPDRAQFEKTGWPDDVNVAETDDEDEDEAVS